MSQLAADPTLSAPTSRSSDDATPLRSPKASKAARIAGWIIGGLPAAFLIMDTAMKFARPEPVLKGTIELGWPTSVILPLGFVLGLSTLLYLIPRTAVLGAILLTGYLGGAVSAHVRVEHPLLTHTLFPVYFGVMLWLGLWLRDLRVRALLPLSIRATA